MKEDGLLKTPNSQNKKLKQLRQPSEKQFQGLESYESELLQDAMQSSIAQEEVICSELKINEELKMKKKQKLIDMSNQTKQPAENFLNKFNCDFSYGNSRLLLGSNQNKQTQKVTISDIKNYEEKAKFKIQAYKLPERLDFNLKVNEVSANKNQKSMKKSLSSKLVKEKSQSFEEKQKGIRSSSNRNDTQSGLKQNRNELDIESVKSSKQISLSRSPSVKKTFPNSIVINPPILYPMTVPFSFENINTAINNLQNIEIQSNSQRSQVQGKKGKEKKVLRQKNLLRQLNSTKYLIDVPLDINEFSYQLDMEFSLEKNRGVQIYMIGNDQKSDGTYFEDMMHFKYEMVKMPPNMLRLRVYLLIEKPSCLSSNRRKTSPQKGQNLNSSIVNQMVEKEWKIWKQIQIPIISNGEKQKVEPQTYKRIKVSMVFMELNWVSIRINNMLDFNLRLQHSQVPVCYFCIDQDYNGVQLMKLSLSGRQKMKNTEDLIGQGCQGKCQLI